MLRSIVTLILPSIARYSLLLDRLQIENYRCEKRKCITCMFGNLNRLNYFHRRFRVSLGEAIRLGLASLLSPTSSSQGVSHSAITINRFLSQKLHNFHVSISLACTYAAVGKTSFRINKGCVRLPFSCAPFLVVCILNCGEGNPEV